MNIDQAKAIPLGLILEKIGCKPAKENTKRSIYLSPLRAEKTPSFHVNPESNLWYDHGIGQGGSIIEFVTLYLQSQGEACTVSDALRWLGNMAGIVATIKSVQVFESLKEDATLVLKNAKPIKHPALIKYLENRGIPLVVAIPYMSEVLVHNTDTRKDFFALGMKNEEEGYEIRNPYFKGCLGAKAITFIRGRRPKPEGIHLFEGMFDFVSAITFSKVAQFEDDAIILNSLSCLKQATPYIKGYGYRFAYTWFDNDPAGEKATQSIAEFLKTEEGLLHRPMNAVYMPDKDVSAWHMNKLSLAM